MRYPESIAGLIAGRRFRELGPGRPDRADEARLGKLTPAEIAGGRPLSDEAAARSCLAGLWLLYDFLDRSHEISQSISTSEGSYWHAIMHRREGDFSNSKYWARRVGDHPVYDQLSAKAGELAAIDKAVPGNMVSASGWDPYRWVDLCEQGLRQGGALAAWCQDLQEAEWQALFDYCYDRM